MLKGLPRPQPDLDSMPFWEGCREKRFLLPRCQECGSFRWPPGPMCPACQSQQTEWVEAAGRGRVYSWIVVNHAPHPNLADQTPYVLALIELEEGVRVLGNIYGCEPNEILPNLAVSLIFEEADDGFVLPNFVVETVLNARAE